jgi:hypothetical protein
MSPQPAARVTQPKGARAPLPERVELPAFDVPGPVLGGITDWLAPRMKQ